LRFMGQRDRQADVHHLADLASTGASSKARG